MRNASYENNEKEAGKVGVKGTQNTACSAAMAELDEQRSLHAELDYTRKDASRHIVEQ